MNKLIDTISLVSDTTLPVMQAVIASNEQSKKFDDDEKGLLPLAAALSDFFSVASAIENSQHPPPAEELSELGEYGLDLLDRLAYFARALEVMDHQDTIAIIFGSTGFWLANNGASFANLNGIADGLGRTVNGLTNTSDLQLICEQMLVIADAAEAHYQEDEDTSDPWRPWRVLNLNTGIAATRSLNPALMERTFEILSRRLPDDMPGFFANGLRMMEGQNVPDDVKDVLNKYRGKWSLIAFH